VTKNKYNFILLTILILSDLFSGVVSFWLTLSNQNGFSLDAISFVFILQCCWSIIFFFANLYDTKATLSRFDEIIRLVPIIYSVLVLFIVVHIFGLINATIDYREVLTYGLVFAAVLIVNRFIIHTIQKFLLNKKIGLNNALILGVNRRGFAVYKNLKDQPFHGLNVKGFVQAYDDPIEFNINGLNINKLGNEADIDKIIEAEKIEDVIIALDKPTPARIMSSIVSINGAPLSIKILPDMYEVVTGLARTTQLVGVPLIDINFNLDTFYSRVLKRIIDVILSIIGILICLPIWILVSLLIKIDSIGPILYLQSRSGKGGELFNIIKFRSMVFNAESDTGPVWAGKEDIRITRIGKLLRRFHVDETPQLINILKGDMSIIGPRPERPFFVEKLKDTYPFYNRRLKIRPGVSGWAQINQPFDTDVKDVHQKLKYDFYYIENLSLRLDSHILFRTIWVVLRGHSK
tara:strand:+ start:1932 stop:3317 length:1386 start_codon:yes stop_codon:yes gene_type:complete